MAPCLRAAFGMSGIAGISICLSPHSCPPDDTRAVANAGILLEVGEEFRCNSPELRRILGPSLLGRVLVLELAETTKGSLIWWN